MNKRNRADKRAVLTAEALRGHLTYDPTTGVFLWKKRRWRRATGVAGCLNSKGYRVIVIDDRQYNASHLAWLYVHGEWPELELDHRDTNRANDRIENLREAQPEQNRANTRPRSASGFKGVRRRWSRWESSLVYKGEYFYLGTFDTPEGAADAYHAKAVSLYGEFARAV